MAEQSVVIGVRLLVSVRLFVSYMGIYQGEVAAHLKSYIRQQYPPRKCSVCLAKDVRAGYMDLRKK